MRKINARGRGRAAASFAVTAALLGGAAAAVSTGPAQSAEPAGDCTEAYPVAEVTDGQAVTGLTVSEGTTPDAFTGEIIGVIEDGIAPGLDMVMADLDSPALTAAGGVWAGMSGSPVYAEDGRLIGAVAYGLSWGPSPIAGITPFEEMDNYLPDPPAPRVKISDRQAREIARASDVSADEAEQGFSQLRIPQRVAGLTASRVETLQSRPKFRDNEYLNKKFAGVGGNIASRDSAPEDLVAGGNLAVSMSYGDVTQGGVGTVTSVCDGGIVGFGHPATFLGTTTLTMHPADALFVQPESLGAPFKVANFGDPAGTISGDHLSGISGTFGALPPTTSITSSVAFDGRSRTGSSYVSVPEANASTTFYQQLVNHDRVLDGIFGGSELMTWSITGTDADGEPFELGMTDRYASTYDITFESPWELADLVYFLSGFEDVTVDEVVVDSDVNDDSSTWRLKTVEQRRDGAWTRITRDKPAIAKRGEALELRGLLVGPADTSMTVPLTLDVPKKANRRGYLVVGGGAYNWTSYWGANNVDEIAEALADAVRNDAVFAELYVSGRRNQTDRVVTEPTDKVVTGQKYIQVKVKG